MASSALANLPQGWVHHGEKLLALAADLQPKVVVELGTWRGASAIALARTVRPWGGVVYCVDTWMGDVNGGTMPGTPAMLTECAGNLVAAHVSSSVRLIVSTTREAAETWTLPIDLLYIDADHSFTSVSRDLDGWAPFVRPGGLICGDDYDNPLYPGVAAAWDAFEVRAGIPLTRYATPHTDPPGMSFIYGWVR